MLYIDDLILTGDEKLMNSFKYYLAREFEMNDMVIMHYLFGLEVWKVTGELFLSQGKYANEILKKFCVESRKPMDTPLACIWRKDDTTLGEEVEATIYR